MLFGMTPWELAFWALYIWGGLWLTSPMTAAKGPLAHNPPLIRYTVAIIFMALWPILFPIVCIAKEREMEKKIEAFRATKAEDINIPRGRNK